MSSPYRTFNTFLQERFGQRVQKITLDAGLTCPHRDHAKRGGCIYCNAQGSGTGAAARGMDLTAQIETQLEAQARRSKARAFIAYFQSFSNTYAPLERLQAIYDTVLPYPEIVGMAIGTRPDCVDDDVLRLITTYTDKRLVWVEYGLQSANDATLARIKRGHDVAAFTEAVRRTAHYPLRICAHVIIGLPGEDLDDYLHTARYVAELPVTDLKIHLMYVIKGTPLADMLATGTYTPLTLEAYARAAAQCLAHLPADMVIQRITGDPHKGELVAPAWAMDKPRVIDTVRKIMQIEGLYQGRFAARP